MRLWSSYRKRWPTVSESKPEHKAGARAVEPAGGDGRSLLERRLQEAGMRLHRQLDGGAAPPVSVVFYPYVSLKHTIRMRDGRVAIRISDMMLAAPFEALEAVLGILLSKLLRRPGLSAPFEREYRRWVRQPEVRERMRRVRARRGRKRLTPPQGRHFDLRPLFAKLNRLYFEDRVLVRHLSWSQRKSRRVLGHYDPAHGAIVVNRRLDHPLVPQHVVEFVLYHEMLHAFLGETECGDQRRFHHPEFRRAERRFADYDRAKAFIDRELC